MKQQGNQLVTLIRELCGCDQCKAGHPCPTVKKVIADLRDHYRKECDERMD